MLTQRPSLQSGGPSPGRHTLTALRSLNLTELSFMKPAKRYSGNTCGWKDISFLCPPVFIENRLNLTLSSSTAHPEVWELRREAWVLCLALRAACMLQTVRTLYHPACANPGPPMREADSRGQLPHPSDLSHAQHPIVHLPGTSVPVCSK